MRGKIISLSLQGFLSKWTTLSLEGSFKSSKRGGGRFVRSSKNDPLTLIK